MPDPVAEAARAVATFLTPDDHASSLSADVEAALRVRDDSKRPDQYLDPISLSSLIVSAAALAWTAYRDLRQQTDSPSAEAITRAVHTELRRSRRVSVRDDEIIALTVEETLAAINEQA